MRFVGKGEVTRLDYYSRRRSVPLPALFQNQERVSFTRRPSLLQNGQSFP